MTFQLYWLSASISSPGFQDLLLQYTAPQEQPLDQVSAPDPVSAPDLVLLPDLGPAPVLGPGPALVHFSSHIPHNPDSFSSVILIYHES